MRKLGAHLLPAAIGLAASLMLPAAAWSTEGYFQLGFSPIQNAQGGAGVANSEDAMAMALNPAGIVGLDEQFQLGVALFMPYRGYTATGTGLAGRSPSATVTPTITSQSLKVSLPPGRSRSGDRSQR